MHTTASPRHRFKPPTFKRGEDHPTANLSDVEVLELRQLKAEGHITYKQLGERFNCSASTAQSIGSYSRRHYAANGQELRPDYRPPIKRASPLTEAPSPEGVSKPEGNTVPINAKLSDNDVRLMRELREQYGMSYRKLADKFDCSVTNVSRIVNYESRL